MRGCTWSVVGTPRGTVWVRPADPGALAQGAETVFPVTVDLLVVISIAIATLTALATLWLAVIGYRSYRQRGTRLVGLATAGLFMIAMSRVVGLAYARFFTDDELAVSMVLSIQVLRSVLLLLGFGLLVYALLTRY